VQDFETIYQEHGKIVYCYLLSLSNDPHLSEELTQETMVRAILNIGSFRGECNLSSWLCQIARNLYLDWKRKQRPFLSWEELSSQAPANGDVAADVETKVTAESVMACLHTLEEPYKEVFLLHALGDVPFTQISKLFGKSDSWARVTYYRAKTMIRMKLEEDIP